MMKTTGNLLRPFGLIIIAILTLISTSYSQDDVIMNSKKFSRLLRLIDSYYVDSANVEKLTETAIVKMLEELDPHSLYISKEEVEKMNEPLKGNFEGIGISFNIFKDTLLVTTTIPGGPSEKVGLMAGDRIMNVDGKNIAGIGLKNDDVFGMLKGEKGTEVKLKILRKHEPELLDFTIIRDKIPIFSLDASYMLNKETGYIKLNKFSATTIDEFKEAMTDLKTKNIKNLILDLRGNGGGYLNAAFDLSDEFLPNDEMIVYTEGIHNRKRVYRARNEGSFEEGKLVVLINEGSASASEIVSGAVQDWDRGIILGRRSYGKGLVQQPYQLDDGSVVRLTTAHYYTPSGRCIQKPYDEGTEEYRSDLNERLANGELFSADSISFNDTLKYKTLFNGRTVYGGGGIMPDIFVPMDTSKYYQYYNRLRRNNIVYTYVLDYIDKNREELNRKYTAFDKFNRNFEVSEDMIAEIVAEGEKKDIKKDEKSLEFTRDQMKKEIKALIARDLFSRHEFYRIINSDDKEILKALEVIGNQEEYITYLTEDLTINK
ncbi:MAG: S41 family peptidase [Prolixibacteraceae bacterium]|nr:S41 family peptidase [Prolixibacteraceae bacterium]MBN2774678.1 S41 family peptidase [Prolixibacteraceae bacterium]